MANSEAEDFEQGNNDNIEETNSQIKGNSDMKNPGVSGSVPKKRGRKKKSEQLNSGMSADEDLIENVRSVRKRKSVNYFALANPDINNEVVMKKGSKLHQDDSNLISVSKKPKLQKKIKVETNLVEDHAEDSSKKIDTEKEPKQSEYINETEKTESENVNNSCILRSVGLRNEKDDIKLDEPCENYDEYLLKEKNYTRTGNTTEMLNTLFSQIDFQENAPTPKEIVTPKKKNRKTKKKTSSNANDLETDTDLLADKKIVTCAICKLEMEKNNWVHHKQRNHNNLAWRIGDKPLDLTNIDLVKQILNALYMAKKPFYCEKCNKSVKSVNGFLSHKSVCGKSSEALKVPCKYCNRKMLPVSLPSHIRAFHEGNKSVIVMKPKENRASAAEIASAKRRAAEKALKVIQNFSLEASGIKSVFTKYFEDISFVSSQIAFTMLQKQILLSKILTCKYPNCNFECVSAEDMRNHLKFCVNKPENGYVCKHCLFVQLTIADVIYHIESVHEVIIEEGDNLKSDKEFNTSQKKKSKPQKERDKKKIPLFLPSVKIQDQIFEDAYKWTIDFCEKNYSTPIPDECYPCLKKNWQLIPADKIVEYIPKMGYSCNVGFETVVDFQDVLHKDHTFRKFQIFESYLENNGNSTIFCGGPINAFSWLPTPYSESNVHQILAVTTKNQPDDKYSNGTTYNEKCIVQFWDTGPLRNLETSMYRPKLRFCLTFDYGPIWDIQWCPSNCFDHDTPNEDSEKLRRMGVMALAASDSTVYIYSVPYLKSNGQFYQSRPIIKLIPAAVQELTLGKKKFYSTRISWSKASGHKYIAVGYTNGMVALFNVTTTSRLLRRKDNNDIDVLIPYKSFQAHCHLISALCLYHLNDGCRWLLTGSYDRVISLWDLNQTSSPIQSAKRNIVNDAVWMTNWLCHVIAYDEASTSNQVCSIVQVARDFLSEPLSLFHSSAAITCLTGSDWLNGIIQANAVGEIFATFPKQLMMNLNWKYLKNKKLLFGFTTLVEKDKTVEERLKEHSEKEKALRNQLTVKTVIKNSDIPANKEVTHLDYNPHYYEYEPLVYHEVDEKYALLFCDHKMNSFTDFPPSLQEHLSYSSKMYGSSKPNIYPLQAINKIQLNPNRQASTHYITGYQAGFVRLTCMKFLNKDQVIVSDMSELGKS